MYDRVGLYRGKKSLCCVNNSKKHLTKRFMVCMVIIMSLYGACEGAFHTGDWSGIPAAWLRNIPRNFIMALPVQFLVAGPLVRRVFRAAFPEGTVLA